jgi:plasmid stability protein
MEAEVRAILTDAVTAEEDNQLNLAQAMRERVVAIGGVELPTPPRRDMPRAADLPDAP